MKDEGGKKNADNYVDPERGPARSDVLEDLRFFRTFASVAVPFLLLLRETPMRAQATVSSYQRRQRAGRKRCFINAPLFVLLPEASRGCQGRLYIRGFLRYQFIA